MTSSEEQQRKLEEPKRHSVDSIIDEGIMNDLKKLWGGRLPTWDEFKKASKGGHVRVNKGIASKAIELSGVPKGHYIVFGIITPWATFLIPITFIIFYFLGKCSGWSAIAGFFGGCFLYKVTLTGSCDGIRHGAEENEALYQTLVSNGAFLFEPPKSLD